MDTQGRRKAALRQQRAERIKELAAKGVDKPMIALRVGVSVRQVYRVLNEKPNA